MSNDSNERGHDTAAQAFQVGDRVRFPLNTTTFSGTVQAVFERNPDGSGLLAVADGEENVYYVNARNLTLISRATPAPAQTDIRIGDLVEFAAFNSALKGEVDAIHDDEAAVMVPAWDGYTALFVPLALLTMLQRPAPENPRIVYKPADPAPTPQPDAPRRDTQPVDVIDLPVLRLCDCCQGTGEYDAGECPQCYGDRFIPDTIRLSDAAVDRLVAALAPVLVKRMVRDIRMIANDRP